MAARKQQHFGHGTLPLRITGASLSPRSIPNNSTITRSAAHRVAADAAGLASVESSRGTLWTRLVVLLGCAVG
jgi:hypothetical protein